MGAWITSQELLCLIYCFQLQCPALRCLRALHKGMALLPPQDNVYCHLASSLCAGFLAVVVGSPADVIKSRMMGECPRHLVVV